MGGVSFYFVNKDRFWIGIFFNDKELVLYLVFSGS